MQQYYDWRSNIIITEFKQTIQYIYLPFSCYYIHIMLGLCLMVGSVLLKVKFGHAQIRVPKIDMLMSKTACINPCKSTYKWRGIVCFYWYKTCFMIKKKNKNERNSFLKICVIYLNGWCFFSMVYIKKNIYSMWNNNLSSVKIKFTCFFKKNFAKNIYSMWNNNLRVWKLSSFFSIFIFISSKMFLHALLLNSDDPFTDQDWIISGPPMWTYVYKSSKWLNIFYQYDGNCVLKNHLIFVAL